MLEAFDRRIVPAEELALLQAFQSKVPFHLGGGAALAGAHLRHRLSADVDLFIHERVAPLPQMLVPLTSEELRAFRDDLRARLRSGAIP